MAPKPSSEELNRRRFVEFTAETIKNTSSTDYPGTYPGEDHSWSVERFKRNFRVQFHESSPLDSSFSLIGIDASIANAFRRILLAEVPTLAIEQVYIMNNTSIMQDEVLASRLGLIPLKGGRDGLHWMKWFKKSEKDGDTGSIPTDYNTVVLQLEVECSWKPDGKEAWKKGERDPRNLYNNCHVYAHQITFQPNGRQTEFFSGENTIQAVNPDILITKLRPGQQLDITMHCHKGIGADHAKFSPVATASYRLMPEIQILHPVIGADAKKFARCFPKGVIALKPITAQQANKKGSEYHGHEGELHAVVADPIKDTVSRECLRHEEFKDKVKLGRIQDHFIFRVESAGQFESDELFVESVRLLKVKCARVKRSMLELMNS